MSEPLRTYEDHLRERGKVTTGTFECPECGAPKLPAFALVQVAPDRWVCSTCHISEQAKLAAVVLEAERAAMPPWETELANHVRAERIQQQERWRWAVMPDSPLTADAQLRVMQFLKLLNTLTIDYTTPEDVVWPVEPTLTETTMTPMLELTLADGRELDIPSGAVVMFEGMLEGANPNFPTAKTFIRYGMGQELKTALLTNKVDDLVFELGVNAQGPSKWLRLTKKTGEAVVLLTGNVVGRLALEEGCEVSYMIADRVEAVEVTQSRREIKKWSERETGRPEGLIEAPVPEDNR